MVVVAMTRPLLPKIQKRPGTPIWAQSLNQVTPR